MEILVILFSIIMCIVPIALIVLIVQAIAKKNNKEGKKDFEEEIRSIYIYLILIITLIAIIAGVIVIFSTGLDIILPEKSAGDETYNNQQWKLNKNIVSLITNITVLLTTLPIFVYHNKLAKKDRETKKQEKTTKNYTLQ